MADAPMRPNLLLVFGDEHRACSLAGEPYCEVQTTHLRRLAREGISFRNCISNYPLCSPYRAMLMSGRWPFQTGVIDNAIGLRSEEFSLGEAFRRAGYHTGYIGKWHLSPDHRDREFIPPGAARLGFEDWQVWSTTNKPHFDRAFTFDPVTRVRVRPRGYSATLMTDAALNFIGEHVGKPWMLVLSWAPPHSPFEDAPPEMLRLYEAGALQFRPNVPAGRKSEMREYLRGYYAHITALDAELGRLLQRLDETGQSTYTIVAYTSDHGTMMGSHGFGGKRLPFEEACRVPFLLRYPRQVPANSESDLLLSAIDLFPSLCGLANLQPPSHCEGKDLSAAMCGRSVRSPDSVFLMHVAKANAEGSRSAPLFRGVRTDRFTYAVADDGRWCLYDNRNDPYQQRNLIGEAAHARTADDLDELVGQWLKRGHDSFPLDELRRHRSSHGAVRH